jgi:phosphate transport system substrate-binding protein
MKSIRAIGLIGLLAPTCLGAANPVSAETLRVGGTGAAVAMLPQLFAAFDGGDAIKLEVIPSLGSAGGLRALADGVLDLAVSGREPSAEERKKGLTVIATIRTPYVLVTSRPGESGLKSSEVATMFGSPQAAWPDKMPVRIVLRPRSDSDSAVLAAAFPGMTAALEEARKRPDVPIAATDQDNAETAERLRGSLAGATFTQIKTENRNLRFVAIDGVAPSLEALDSGAYPYTKTLYFVAPAKPRPALERFVVFLRSVAGQAALRATGNFLVAGKREQ